ncbi:WXG100 family type VII secretion target [Demequina sp. SYSU T00039]|uniref:ESAT-6-like protein n=2 Tax=Demequina lignilytica TaxID=3051663 RepID=A0AAW7M8T4_9MICO|nr:MULTISPECIES: WXG100 family type VII secretion target [unclassified Demequina]MDN4477504.1 WXG100 family type VII secretion target [Demequina sp. SYSU T00039-1]MDN4483548.1 WXG100 family type VII secretion target [Demequina sp. SYSU T0a273]MDN4488145.1 WXG100 family type VII secretion target [Demequina sp. SYSU T00039]MDN4490586.1 WXG100 family type VII secretion target [Demequina sp. SYSU T00068]
MQFHVDAAEVAAAAARTAHTADAIRGETAAMLAHLTALEGSWQGSAAAAFGDVREQWRAAQVQVEAALDAITQALGAAARSYEDAEATATRLFAR